MPQMLNHDQCRLHLYSTCFMPIQGNPFLSPPGSAIIGTMPGPQFFGQDFDGDGIANMGPVVSAGGS